MNLEFLKKGQVKVEIKTFDINKLLNVLWRNGINVENVRKIDVVTLTLNVDYSDYGKLKTYVKRLNGKVKIISSKGMIFFLSRAKKSISIFVGVLIFLVGLYIYSGFIWRIDIETKKNIAPFEIRTMLNDFDIKPGVKKSSVNVYGLERKLENGHGDIMWVNARIEGGTLKIKVEEKVSPKIKEENENKEFKNLYVTVLSFGFKYGIPNDAELVFDVRFLPNPYYLEEMRPKTGNDKEIREFVMKNEKSIQFLEKLEDMVRFLIPNYIIEGKHQLVIAIGCTGGKHRSVTLANELYEKLCEDEDYGIKIEHRDIEKDAKRKL